MFKKIALTLCALALVFATGCRHRCCQKASVSSSACCPTALPPGALPPG